MEEEVVVVTVPVLGELDKKTISGFATSAVNMATALMVHVPAQNLVRLRLHHRPPGSVVCLYQAKAIPISAFVVLRVIMVIVLPLLALPLEHILSEPSCPKEWREWKWDFLCCHVFDLLGAFELAMEGLKPW